MNPEAVFVIYLLAALFFVVAFAYSSVGLGGGSSYTALMAIAGVNTLAIPIISLSLNLVVTTAGSFNFIRNRHARTGLILPFLASSMPLSYLGGTLGIRPHVFYWVLLVSLVFVAVRIYAWKNTSFALRLNRPGQILVSLAAGAVLGLVAGITGIGGGIFLVPLILLLGLGTEKEAAASGAIFIWLNSLAGLASRMQYNAIDWPAYLPMIAAVLAGGLLGSHMGAARFSPATLERVLGIVIIMAIVFLTRKVCAL